MSAVVSVLKNLNDIPNSGSIGIELHPALHDSDGQDQSGVTHQTLGSLHKVLPKCILQKLNCYLGNSKYVEVT